jgi:AcrR family transcriptional regulator
VLVAKHHAKAIRSDNCEPFASVSDAAGLTKLFSLVGTARHLLERIDPGKPYQQRLLLPPDKKPHLRRTALACRLTGSPSNTTSHSNYAKHRRRIDTGVILHYVRFMPAARAYLRAPERRAQILGIAKRLFARSGYHRVNVADICDAARIGRGTLYQHFRNKEQVLLALLEDVVGRVDHSVRSRTRVADARIDPRDPDAIVGFCERQLRHTLDAIFSDEATLRLVFRQARAAEGLVQRTLARIDKLVLGAIEADMRDAQRAGAVVAGDVQLFARFVLGGLEKVLVMTLQNDEPLDLDAVVRQTVRLQLFGVLAPRSPRR